ncbi:hydroxyacid dehydrogenase, partial [Candidatus Bathyarchaeota archaeon]|nr:hydroxyacid dehydrogenase [Candidatus Bathyarchaeota archaeon]
MIMYSTLRREEYGVTPSLPREFKTINGSVIGIVGASTVGREVIRLLKPFDCKILVYDP